MTAHPVALVTGASRGIGRAIALELARCGYAVVVNFAHNAAAADEVVELILNANGSALAVPADVADSADRARLVAESLSAFGRIDVLVNNAGITSAGRRDLLEATEESWDAVFGVNLKGPFFLSQTVAREMVRLIREGTIPQGKIINVSSISAAAGSTDRADYCIAKSAIRMMTELFAARLADEQIRVYEVRPGVIETDMTAPVKAKYDSLIASGTWPLRRWGQGDDVAKAVAALVGDFFPFSTGDCLNVDGGFHIRRL
ncbi:MAG: 3-ketoacyl-ACP reductase [Planctomycetota bacterium]|nr:MAG: 3-ketoacyl-ACP reductase [Planctomycetota bacterium]